MDEQRKWYLKMESTTGEDAEKIVEITAKNLVCYLNLADTAAVGVERIDSNFERTSSVGKMLSKSMICYREGRKSPLS